MSIKDNTDGILIPSEESHLKMYPMDFEEFLWATGDDGLMDIIRESFAEKKPMGQTMHRRAMERFREYMVVGGMPQVVAAFADSHDLRQVDAVKRSILALYRADIRKFAGALKDKALTVFNAISSQLSKHEKKFMLAELDSTARMRGYDTTFEWLDSAMTVNLCRAANEPNVGLEMNCERMSLKCYLGDTGLLVSMAFSESELASSDIHNRILSDRIELNKGMLVENVIAQMFRAAGHKLYFYSNSSRTNSEDRMEIDFLLAKPGLTRRHNISPVEVKSGRSYAYESLSKFRRRFANFLDKAYVLHVKDVNEKDGVLHLPLYMAPLLVSAGDMP
jgi:predicted AAA+ superfamily ATPase